MGKKLSWFQWVIIIFLTFGLVGSRILQGQINLSDIFGSLGDVLGSFVAVVIIVWVVEKLIGFIVSKIDIENNTLVKAWKITKIVITCLIGLWFLLFLSGNIMGSLLIGGFIIAIIFIYLKRKKIKLF